MQTLHATTPEQFEQALATYPRLLVDFHKDQCPSCTMLDLSLKRFSEQADAAELVLLKIKLEEVGESLFRQLGLRQTPTLSVYVAGVEQARLTGFQSPQQIAAAVAGSAVSAV